VENTKGPEGTVKKPWRRTDGKAKKSKFIAKKLWRKGFPPRE